MREPSQDGGNYNGKTNIHIFIGFKIFKLKLLCFKNDFVSNWKEHNDPFTFWPESKKKKCEINMPDTILDVKDW